MAEHTSKKNSNLTSVILPDSAAKGREEDNRKGSCIFPSIDKVGEGILGVTVTPHTLSKTKPCWQ